MSQPGGDSNQESSPPAAAPFALPPDFASWTPEAKATYMQELQGRLQALKSKQSRSKAGQGQPTEGSAPNPPPAGVAGAKQYPATRYGYTLVSSKRGQQGGGGGGGGGEEDMYFDDDDYEDEDDEYEDEDLEMFEQGLDRLNRVDATDTPASATSTADTGSMSAFVEASAATFTVEGKVCVGVKTDQFFKKEFLGDFELLRLAKMGDVQSFKEFETAMNEDLRTFKDNRNRNALHYAADAGCEELVDYLKAKGVPVGEDEKGMTPVHIAILLKRSPQLIAKLGGSVNPYQTFEVLMDRFAPPVPKFVLSKAAPVVKPTPRQRFFWVPSPPAAAQGLVPQLQLEFFEPLKPLPDGCRTQFFNLANKLAENTIFAWAKAFESEAAFGVMHDGCLSIGAVHPTSDGAALQLAGSVLALPLGGQIVAKSGAALPRPAQAGQLHVTGWIERRGVAVRLMSSLAARLRDMQVGGAFFRSRERLPVEPVCLVKWTCRCIDPLAIIARVDVACEILPDFFAYDERLRVDAAVKGYLPPPAAPASEVWARVLPDDAATIASLCQFYTATVPAQADLSYRPEGPADMAVLVSLFFVFAKKSPATGAVTDFFALRLLNPRDSDVRIQGAVIVFSLFSTLAGEARVNEIAAFARLNGMAVLYATNTCGFTDSDLSKAKFDEIEAYREYLYVVKGEGMPMLSVGVAPSKVFLPVGPI